MKNSDANKVFLSKIETLPLNIFGASKRHDSKKWLAAFDLELKGLQNSKACDVVKIPAEHQVVSTRFVLTKKFRENSNSERLQISTFCKRF